MYYHAKDLQTFQEVKRDKMSEHKERLTSSDDSAIFSDEGLYQMTTLKKTTAADVNDNHEYANPQDVVRSLKKKNLLYEPLPEKSPGPLPARNHYHRPMSYDEDDGPTKKDRSSSCTNRLLFIAMFIVSTASFLFTLLMALGVIQVACQGCIKEATIPSYLGSVQNSSENDVIKEEKGIIAKEEDLHNNITYLTDILIPSLMDRIKHLESKVGNNTVRGPRGLAGPVGPTGPPGVGDLSKCEYGSKSTSWAYERKPEDNSISVNVSVKKGYIVTGVSCEGGSENAVTQKNVRGVPRYGCECAGIARSKLFRSETTLVCRAHYWQCPKNS